MTKPIGIDLGTTFSAVAVIEGGKPVIIPNVEGERTTPSVVLVKGNERVVGRLARNQAILYPENTVRSIKRHMGEDFRVTLEGKDYAPQEISAIILQKLKADAEAYLGHKVTDAVITCPAYFTDAQRQATKDAGKIAGLNVLRIVNEPTAAALAYGLDKGKAHTILVFDFGGGTFDVSVLELGDGVFEVKATAGNNHLGGDDIDDVLIDWLADEFKKQYGIDLREDKNAMQRLKESAEKAKIELSTKTTTSINLPFITADKSGPKHLVAELTRAKFESLVAKILDKLREPTLQAIKDAGLKADGIDKIILVGGSTRIPAVQRIVNELAGKEGEKSVNPDEAVALGAAIQAGILKGDVKDLLLLDVTPLSLGIETLGGVSTRIIDRNTTIPTKKTQVFSTAADNQTAVTIHVLQGERPMAGDNKTLGRFDLVGIPPAPRGIPQIEVVFDIDANGIVHVSAKDLGTGRQQKITITTTTNLSEGEIERMRKEAEQNEQEDKQKKELVELINQGDTLVYSVEKALADFDGKIEKGKLDALRKKTEELRSALASKDKSSLKAKIDELQKILNEASTELYQKQGAHQKKPEDDVVDANAKVDEET